MGFIIQIGIFGGLLLLALITGSTVERRHFRSLNKREDELSGMHVTNFKRPTGAIDTSRNAEVVIGQTVTATDYLKSFLAGIRKIFGGELRSYETLMERSQREATLRMLEEARDKGYNAVCNVRLQFADIGSLAGNKGMVTVEVFAFGTAYRIKN